MSNTDGPLIKTLINLHTKSATAAQGTNTSKYEVDALTLASFNLKIKKVARVNLV